MTCDSDHDLGIRRALQTAAPSENGKVSILPARSTPVEVGGGPRRVGFVFAITIEWHAEVFAQ